MEMRKRERDKGGGKMVKKGEESELEWHCYVQ